MVSGTLEVTLLPSAQGLSQRTAGAQASTSRLSRQGDDADVELGFLDDEADSPSMLGMQATSALPPRCKCICACVTIEAIVRKVLNVAFFDIADSNLVIMCRCMFTPMIQ